MHDFLEKILAHKRQLNDSKKEYYASIRQNILKAEYSRYRLFSKQISQEGKINLIAEIKKASPSQGLIRQDFDVLAIAKIYSQHGAAAISVLTEDKYFLGDPDYVKKVSEGFNLPVLTKDFIIDEGQIYEARVNGASAILLIMAVLSDDQVKEFLKVAHKIDLDCLVEVHNEEELKRALALNAEIIGINNRNLRTFEVDLETSKQLVKLIPKEKIIVAESGLKTHEDIMELKEMGVNAVLIGETFMRADDIGSKIDELIQAKD